MDSIKTSMFRLGTPLTKDKLGHWKSLTPIYRGDDLIAFVGMEAGWKKKWKLYPIRPTTRDSGAVDGYEPNDGNFNRDAINIYNYGNKSGNGRDLACQTLEEVFDPRSYRYRHAENFKTAAEREAAEAKFKAQRLAEEDKHRQAVLNLQSARRTRLAALRSILPMDTLDGDQRDALFTTVNLLQSEVDHYQGQLDRMAA